MKLTKKIGKLITGFIQVLSGKGGAFHAEEQRLLNTYYTADHSPIKNLKTGIVMMIDGRTMHGGLSDRLRGICSIYYWCKLHRVPFYIHYNYPFSLADYLPIGKYNWSIANDELSYNSQQSSPVLLMLHLLPSKLHKLYLHKLYKSALHKQLHVYSNTLIYDKHYSQAFGDLFSLAQPLQLAVAHQLQSIGTPYIAMVLRFQQLLDDFKEGDYEVLSPQAREELIHKCLRQIDYIHSTQAPNHLVLITSESVTFLQRAAAEFPYVRIISGKVVHMDYTLDATYDVYLKSFVDMVTLSHAEKIYLLQTGKMYKSGFAYRAAAINNTPYESIEF